jgi:soluble lytic murein transglycosylase
MQTDESILYWKARALEQLGDQEWAIRVFDELSERRDYYGFLAADKVGKPGNLRHVPLTIGEQEYAAVGRNQALQRAYELFKLERYTAARKEWNLLSKSLTDREKLVAAKLAHNWGWYDRPIFTLAEVGYMNDVNLRFPVAHKHLLLNSAKKNKLDPAHVFAIARRESSFMHDAYSSAGAAGLMQIKPSTASYMAKRKVKRKQLFKPDQNAKLATHYLAYLLQKSKGDPVVATAAYNAGFGKVKKWLPKQKTMSADAWIETIPYKETRNYVKAVTAYTEVYQQLLEQDSEVFSNLDEVAIAPTF